MSGEAGREMDALIAERVMGFTPIPVLAGTGCEVTLFVEPPRRVEIWNAAHPRPYSTDIAAAWEVVEKVQGFDTNRTEPWWSVAVFFGQRGQVCARVYACQPGWLITDTDTVIAEAHADTAPLAICRAALAATVAKS